MNELVSRFKIDYWYHALMVVGAGGMLAALTVEVRAMTNPQAFALFAGVFLVGMGEWINHPLQERIVAANMYMPAGKISGHPRSNSALGVVFVLSGLGLIGAVLWRLLD